MSRGKASVICRASHSAVGCRVTSNHSNCRRPWPRTKNANNRSKVSVGTTHISIAAITSMWFRRNVLQDCEGGLRPCTMYLEAVDWATSNPSISNSPWIRGAPPERILSAHPSDEIAQLTIDLGPPCPISGFPAPKRFEAGTMPSQDGLRLHDLGDIEQAGPNARHPYQQRPITAVQPQPRRRSPQCDVKLMMKKQVLGLQPASRLENVDNEDPEHVQDRKHRRG